MRFQQVTVVALFLFACGGEPETTEKPLCYEYEPAAFSRPGEVAKACTPQNGTLCFEYQPAPLTRPDDVWRACVPPDWPYGRAAVRGIGLDVEFEPCPRMDEEYAVFFWVWGDHKYDPGHMSAGCVPRWSCRYDDLVNPACCEDVELVNGFGNCFEGNPF